MRKYMKKMITVTMITVMTSMIFTGCNKKDTKEEAVSNGTVQEVSATPTTAGTANTQSSATENSSTSTENNSSTSNSGSEQSAQGNETKATGITYPYTYKDAAGRDVVIEAEPVKIATNYLPIWETLIMLDVKPIAVSGAENYIATWDAFKGYDVSGVKDLGAKEMNLELLAELQPDIIINQSYDVSNLDIENLTKISNVAVLGNETKMDWRLSLTEVAKVVNKEEKAAEVIADIDNRLAEVRTKLDEKYSGQTVIQVSIMGEDKYYCAYRSDLYDDKTGLGLNLPEGYTTSETYEQISLEAIVEMNPDYIFLNIFDGSEALYEALQKNSVWQSLKAVQDGHVFILDGGGHACSPLATLYTVNFITDALLGE